MKTFVCLIAVLLLAPSLSLGPCLAAEGHGSPQQDSLDSLIDVLAQKGVLTPEESADLKARAAQAEEPAPPPAPEKPKYPTLKTKVRVEARVSSVQEDENQPYFGNRDDRTGGDGFAVRRARLYFMGDLNPNTGYKIQYQSDWGHTNPNLHVAQMDWRSWDFADLSVGQLQTPFGYEIVMSDAYLLCTDRAAVSDFLPPDKDIGLLLSSKKSSSAPLAWKFFVGNGSGKYAGDPTGDYLWIGRLQAKPTSSVTVGAGYSSNRNTDFSPYQSRFLKKNGDPYGLLSAYAAAEVDETSWELDAQWTSGSSSVWAEYIRSEIDAAGGPAITADGYYIYLHQFLPYKGTKDKLEGVLGYQQFDANTDVTDQFDLTSYTLGLNYHLTGSRYAKQRCQQMIRLNYIWNREAADEVNNDKCVLQYQTWF